MRTFPFLEWFSIDWTYRTSECEDQINLAIRDNREIVKRQDKSIGSKMTRATKNKNIDKIFDCIFITALLCSICNKTNIHVFFLINVTFITTYKRPKQLCILENFFIL